MASSKKPQRGELAARLETFLAHSLRPGQRLLLGLSGGLDSCVLLHLLAGLRETRPFELSALHINHGISPNAGYWQDFCADLCARYQIPFAAVSVSVARDSGLGLEAAARETRYRVLLAQPVDAIALAHHQDDQAETLLLQLLRGAGVKGLAAMPEQSIQIDMQPTLLRPLLDISRSALEAYAHAHQLSWIEDESNLDLAFDRNFLRHYIFPALEQRFPASRVTLARSAAHFAEAADLLDEIAAQDAKHHIRQGRLAIAGLRALSVARAKNLLRFWLDSYLPAPPSARRLKEVYRQLLEARPESELLVVLEGGQVRRYRDEAWFKRAVAVREALPFVWHGQAEVQCQGGRLTFRRVVGAGLSLDKLGEGQVQIRARQGGERIRLDRKRPTRSLKNLFQEAGIPPWQRIGLPMVYLRDELVAVPGIGVACDWQAAAGEEGVLIEWISP